jgi:lactate dehydrogenase-like 2-hydroxyacid dehydrogenase
VLTEATADMAMCLMLAAARHLKAGINAVREGRWKTWEPLGYLGHNLKGLTVGIVGPGRIGTAFAERCIGGWDMEVFYCSRTQRPYWEGEFDAQWVSIDEMCEFCDIISLHCPLTDETRHLLDADHFELMKQGAILVNTSRGEVVDQEALFDALTEGPLGAAGLDVTDPEPLDPAHPLVGLENCVIAPHTGSATYEAREEMAVIAASNLLAVFAGVPMEAEVAKS